MRDADGRNGDGPKNENNQAVHSYTYDASGNPLTDGVYRYTWQGNRLQNVRKMADNSLVATFTYDEEGCAWIILHAGQESSEEEMKAYGASHMAMHKVPRYFVFVKEFPMNAAGKILKYKMREISIEKLGLK